MSTTENPTRIARVIESTEQNLEYENERLRVNLAALTRDIEVALLDLQNGMSVQPIDAHRVNEAITARRTLAHQLTVLRFVADEDAEGES